MDYTVTKRGPRGEPQEIQCAFHPGCSWKTQSLGAKTETDIIFVAQFRNHLQEAKTPDVQAFGHLRRARANPKKR